MASYEAQPIPIGGAALLTTSDGRLVRVRVHGLPTRDETIALRFDDDRVETHPIAMLQRAR